MCFIVEQQTRHLAKKDYRYIDETLKTMCKSSMMSLELCAIRVERHFRENEDYLAWWMET